MIRALRACLHDAGLRRLVGIVAVLAFALVIVLGASHAGEKADAGHDHCGVCVAVGAIGTSESFGAPQLSGYLEASDATPVDHAEVLFASEPRRSHAPRGPPSLA